MNDKNARQRIRREETRYLGRNGSLEFQVKEHSVFMEDGNIVSRERKDLPIVQGVAPHDPDDVAGQCQSCLSFTTKLLVCDLCWQVVCLPCASRRSGMTVCPACAQYLKRRRWLLIFRKLFIEPFVERVR